MPTSDDCLKALKKRTCCWSISRPWASEDRQGSPDFNVAAYADNCAPEICDAFGESWECCCFCWMLNQDMESEAVAAGKGYRTWLAVELAYYQNEGFQHVNGYREEVGVDPFGLDPEMVAFTNYHAYHDAILAIRLHDSINGDDMSECMALLGVERYGENTYKWHSPGSSVTIIKIPYITYRGSESH